ncbi:SDR family NAD(P)-dependent oxidoreductase [Altererythrobacter sp. CC-YST694]|uniref:SDR family NAD(P)-dependent oxidoreductase n=1 Tax=Altererythrobacter sp. CC-YST694 TaxID=2755038 RepID=UPI001D02275C|nr:SDR family NAD(P)-dependent oxidoreductase [Altererythrobacter sp. CC-YST694]MCB5425158.1 SDR family NAD(P)-dependent oxidoreductase [Altererythrobacter sp. CC-YST694]
MGLLEGKIAIVTGAGRGIGRCHALTLAREGAAVLVNDAGTAITGGGQDAGPAAQVAAEIIAAGGHAIADTSDIGSWNAPKALVERALDEFGRLDIVVNNAGITLYDSIATESGENWQRVMDVNLTGTAALIHWAARYWESEGPQLGRAVVNTSSPAGTNPPPGAISYVVSKAGVAALTMAAATELCHLGVRVNALAPMARSRMSEAIPMLDKIMKVPESGLDRMAPENVSRLMFYLTSPACRFTGRVFGADGDRIYLFQSMSAEPGIDNGGKVWTQKALASALEAVPQRDASWMIAPNLHVQAGAPPQDVLDAFGRIARDEPVRVWAPIDRR